jgi:hypothetical protein
VNQQPDPKERSAELRGPREFRHGHGQELRARGQEQHGDVGGERGLLRKDAARDAGEQQKTDRREDRTHRPIDSRLAEEKLQTGGAGEKSRGPGTAVGPVVLIRNAHGRRIVAPLGGNGREQVMLVENFDFEIVEVFVDAEVEILVDREPANAHRQQHHDGGEERNARRGESSRRLRR